MISIDYTGRIGATVTCSLRLEAPTKGCKVQARKQKHCSLCQMVWSWDQIAFGAPHSLSVVPDLDPSPSQHPSRSIKGFRRTWLESSYIYHRTPSDLSRMGHFNYFFGYEPFNFRLTFWILGQVNPTCILRFKGKKMLINKNAITTAAAAVARTLVL